MQRFPLDKFKVFKGENALLLLVVMVTALFFLFAEQYETAKTLATTGAGAIFMYIKGK